MTSHDYKEDDESATEMECPSCHKVKMCVLDTDPYAEEINNDSSLVWECGECRYQSLMDI